MRKGLIPVELEPDPVQAMREALMDEMVEAQTSRIIACAVKEAWSVQTVPPWFSAAVAALENVLALDEPRGLDCARVLFGSTKRGTPLQQIAAADRLLSALVAHNGDTDEADHC